MKSTQKNIVLPFTLLSFSLLLFPAAAQTQGLNCALSFNIITLIDGVPTFIDEDPEYTQPSGPLYPANLDQFPGLLIKPASISFKATKMAEDGHYFAAIGVGNGMGILTEYVHGTHNGQEISTPYYHLLPIEITLEMCSNGLTTGDVVLNFSEKSEPKVVGDIDGDGMAGFSDFLVLSDNFGMNVEPGTNGDLDGNGMVAFPDFLILSQNVGKSN